MSLRIFAVTVLAGILLPLSSDFLVQTRAAFSVGTGAGLSNAEVLAKLERFSPGFQDWAAGLANQQRGKEAAAQYLSMAPLEQYLIADRNAEIAMARSAAPPSISSNAEVMVLGRHGYETTGKGKNGFVCLVERSWMSPFDFAEFWNPKMRGPICFNPAAARSILPLTFKRTELVLAGLSKAQIMEGIKDYDAKGLPALEPGAMCYMMSPQGFLNDAAGHWVPHLMFYIPLADAKSWGADLPGSPVMLNPQFQGAPEPITEFMIPVLTWSDGTPAPRPH